MVCMLLGYAQNHTGGTYQMLNLCAKRIVLSYVVIWQKKPMVSTYKEKNKSMLTVIPLKIRQVQ